MALCLDRFIDRDTAALREFFASDWTPMPGTPGEVLEPGHHYEWAFLLDLECAPDGGQIAGWELTGATGLSEDESHGQAPHPQHRIQTADRPGLHCRRDASCSRHRLILSGSEGALQSMGQFDRSRPTGGRLGTYRVRGHEGS